MFFSSAQNLVGCTHAILDTYDEHAHCRVYKAMGVKTKNEVELETLELQLNEVISKQVNKAIEDICFDIYVEFDSRLSQSGTDDYIRHNLSRLPCILTEKKFVFPSQVVLSLPHDCSPYLFGLKAVVSQRFPVLMEILGVRTSFEPEDVVNVLTEIKEQHDMKKLPEDMLQLVCRIATILQDFESLPSDLLQRLYLPDIFGFFYRVDELCIDDCPWLPTTKSMKFLNTKIPLKLAKLVGIKSKREQSFIDESEGIGCEFGQHEELTKRIKRILDSYTDMNIMKELLQNADDAGATEIHFIKDFRTHESQHVFSENWKDLQGAALCVFNDSVFTDKDFLGIQNLGTGSKEDDPTKTGQYGVGFNVVYHLTDVPSFLTRDLDNGQDTLCVLDPQRKYIPQATEKKPGRKFPNVSQTVKKKYKDIMSCYLENTDVWKTSSGTLFRFPLRSTENSLLSPKLISPEDVERLLNDLKTDMTECLLFLHNVKSITISSMTEYGGLVKEFKVSVKRNKFSSDNGSIFSTFADAKQQMKTDPRYLYTMDRKEVKYHLNIDINNQGCQKWLIINSLGFHDKTCIPQTIHTAYNDGKLALLPSSGIAINLKNTKIEILNKKKIISNIPITNFKAYCVLPLPVQTGMPVHVNGHFALDHEVRHNIWWPDALDDDFKKCWNKTLIENAVVPTYASAMIHLKELLFPDEISNRPWAQLDKFHKVFPSLKLLKDKIWQHMAKELYRFLLTKRMCVFPFIRKEYYNKDISKVKKTPETQISSSTPCVPESLQNQPLAITWTTVCSSYFNDIDSQLSENYTKESYYSTYEKSHQKLKEMRSEKAEFLAGILQSLGMLILESPLWIFNSMKDANVDVHLVSPRTVLYFLKTYKTSGCAIEKVNIPVSQTILRSAGNVVFLLKYCLRDKQLTADDFADVPLLLTADDHIRDFRMGKVIYLTNFPNVLPASYSKLGHLEELSLLRRPVLETFMKDLDIADFSRLLPESVPQIFCNDCKIEWDLKSPKIPNMQWMKNVWAFPESNLNSFIGRELEVASKYPVSEEEKNEFLYIKKFTTEMLELLGKWNLVPARIKGENDVKSVVFPIQRGKHVLRLIYWEHVNVQKALQVLNLPVFDEICMPKIEEGFLLTKLSTLLKCIVATVTNATDTLECVHSNAGGLVLQGTACSTVLEYFAHNLDLNVKSISIKEKLASLPFYTGVFEECISVNNKNVLILPSDVPIEGLLEWSRGWNLVLIKEIASLINLYRYVGCIKVSIAEFYVDYLLPRLDIFPSEMIFHHMKYIKDILLPQMENHTSEKGLQLKMLKELLHEIRFLPTMYGRNARASEFFDPHIKIFQLKNLLCKPSELPPEPYSEAEWRTFLTDCGMKSEFTPDIFLQFAKRLEKLGDLQGITNIVRENSEFLVDILFRERHELTENNDFMIQVKCIRFICPHPIQNDLIRIVSQYQNCQQLICFKNSTVPENRMIVWSVLGIISERTFKTMELSKANHEEVIRSLDIFSTPPIFYVTDHVQKVCASICSHTAAFFAEDLQNEQTLAEIMNHIYKYLGKYGNYDTFNSLRKIPFIFIRHRKILIPPPQVVLDMSECDEIPPYLCRAPLYFGRYFRVFQDLGAMVTVTSKHLAIILHKIYTESKGSELEPNEKESAKKAVQQLFKKLRDEKPTDFGLTVLYLPSKLHNLVQSNELVFVDDKLIESRIGESMPDLNFFVGFQELAITDADPLSLINLLPLKHRPHLLSKIVIEKLKPHCKELIVTSSHACKVQQFLRSKDFFGGVSRLVRDEFSKSLKEFREIEQKAVFDQLQMIFVHCLETLETVLTYENAVLSNTDRQKKVFSTIKDDGGKDCLNVYFKVRHVLDMSFLMNDISMKLSTMINVYLGEILTRNILFLPEILKCINDPKMIECRLDSFDIMAIDVGQVISMLPFMPELGTEISVSLHHLLDNYCTVITSGTYIAFEVYDPIVDQENPEKEDKPIYILAQVKEIYHELHASTPNELDVKYKIDIGSDELLHVEASRVYRFVRRENIDKSIDVVDSAGTFKWNIDRVKVYIRDVMRKALTESVKEFKRRVKRFLLQYHPDKHTESKSYYEQLTMFINFIKGRLENDQSVDDEVIFGQSSSQESSTSRFSILCFDRGSSYAENDRNYVGGTDSSDSSFFKPFFEIGPQPGQAKRWYRQAEIDFNAASTDQYEPNAYNWTCYKCHQAVEKALKALQYQLDAGKVSLTHSLKSLASSISDDHLSNLADRLENITGNYFQMRYPDAVSGGCIPSDLYKADHATKAIECAREIMQIVHQKIHCENV